MRDSGSEDSECEQRRPHMAIWARTSALGEARKCNGFEIQSIRSVHTATLFVGIQSVERIRSKEDD